MEKIILSISGWWISGFIALVLFVVWLRHTIKIYKDPEFRFSQQAGIPYALVKEYQKAWDDIAEAGKKSKDGYDYQKSKEILSKLSDDTYWLLYSNWKHSQYMSKVQEKLDKGQWWDL